MKCRNQVRPTYTRAVETEGHRHERLQQLLLEELNGLLRDDVADPRLDDVRVTTVELSIDYGTARAWYALPNFVDKKARAPIEKALEKAAGFLRVRIAESLALKKVPQLRFSYDEATQRRGT